VVMLAWILFRTESTEHAYLYVKSLLDFNFTPQQKMIFLSNMHPEFILAAIIGILGSTKIFTNTLAYIRASNFINKRWRNLIRINFHGAAVLFYSAILILCTLYLVSGTYNPFIYYRF
jgi:alginate O-acetyltransferase complex protein AlgI